MYLWELPNAVADLDAYTKSREMYEKMVRGEITREDYQAYLKENPAIVFHRGLDAMAYTVQQMPRVYEEVMSKYPNGTVGPWNEDPRNYCYTWLGDRAGYGLAAGIGQFLGFNETTIERVRNWNISSALEFINLAKSGNGIDQYLDRNWKYWDLIKFIYGYGGANYVGWDTNRYDNLYLPIAMKAFGIPHSNRGIEYEHYIDAPARHVVILEDIVFGLPDAVLQPIKAGQYNETLIFPGNGISCIGSPLYGIRKDIAYGQQNPVEPNAKYMEAYLPIRGNKIYFFKFGQKG
jgi:hypothetical protein